MKRTVVILLFLTLFFTIPMSIPSGAAKPVHHPVILPTTSDQTVILRVHHQFLVFSEAVVAAQAARAVAEAQAAAEAAQAAAGGQRYSCSSGASTRIRRTSSER